MKKFAAGATAPENMFYSLKKSDHNMSRKKKRMEVSERNEVIIIDAVTFRFYGGRRSDVGANEINIGKRYRFEGKNYTVPSNGKTYNLLI